MTSQNLIGCCRLSARIVAWPTPALLTRMSIAPNGRAPGHDVVTIASSRLRSASIVRRSAALLLLAAPLSRAQRGLGGAVDRRDPDTGAEQSRHQSAADAARRAGNNRRPFASLIAFLSSDHQQGEAGHWQPTDRRPLFSPRRRPGPIGQLGSCCEMGPGLRRGERNFDQNGMSFQVKILRILEQSLAADCVLDAFLREAVLGGAGQLSAAAASQLVRASRSHLPIKLVLAAPASFFSVACAVRE